MVTDRLDPYDLLAEESVLGAGLIDSNAIEEVRGWLKVDHFYRDKNQWIYQAMLNLLDQECAINTVTVSHELDSINRLDDIGGTPFLLNLIENAVTSVYNDY